MNRKILFCTLLLTTLLLGGCTQGNTREQAISEQEAKEIALNHAGLTADQVSFVKSGIDRDFGQEKYDVEFYTRDQKEYDYEIDCYDGTILEWNVDSSLH